MLIDCAVLTQNDDAMIQYLSFPLSSSTPAYGGGESIRIKKCRDINEGDSCNQIHFEMSNHIGTHVDVPLHFDPNGRSITDYSPSEWIFKKCILIELNCFPGDVVDSAILESFDVNHDAELVFLKTGMGKYRGNSEYWESSVIFDSSISFYCQEKFPNLQAIALDTISLTSLLDRDMGKLTHRYLLSAGIRIFEDVNMDDLESAPKSVTAYPLLLQGADGAPVTIVADT